MARGNVGLIAFNRGLVSPKALARVDLDRTKLSAEVMTNWLPKTQGAMRIRPGTKYLGSSLNDSGAAWIEFVAATDDVALVELTNDKMRIWIDDALLGRPAVNTTVALSDTGWSNTSTGGALATAAVDIIPVMTAATTNGVTITANSQNVSASTSPTNRSAWKAADNDIDTFWEDTGAGNNSLPSWWNVNFGSGNTKAVTSYSIRSRNNSGAVDNAPRHWRLITGNYDTGTYAIDTGKWTLEDERDAQIDWAVAEKRTYTLPGADTGTVEARRHWRLFVTQVDTGAGSPSYQLDIGEIEMFDAATAQQVKKQSGTIVLNATSIGARARYQKRVMISDTGTEHALAIHVDRGPVTLRVGSSAGDDDYIPETAIGTGYHNLAFTPQGNFHITLQSDAIVDRIIQSLTMSDTGTVEITTPIPATSLDDVRYDQSADVVFVDAYGIPPGKIERRGTGRSWSYVYLQPNNGPFLPTASSSAKLSISGYYGNKVMYSDIPFFSPDHATNGGALIRAFHSGQSGQWALGAQDAATDAIEITGIKDTGTQGANSERALQISVSGTHAGTLLIERSFEGPDYGFHNASTDVLDTGTTPTAVFGKAATDTGTFNRVVYDKDNNVSVWYRVRYSSWTSGVALVTMTYKNGGVNGIARVTGYNSNQSVDVEILSRFSDTGGTDSWSEGAWSAAQRYPSAVALHESRLCHAGGATLWASVSDDYENHNDETVGDAGPLYRTLGSGPVDKVFYLVSLLRLVMGMAGAEVAVRSSSLDEPLTPSNNSAKSFSTQGSANLRAVKIDNQAVFVQRSGARAFTINATQAFGEYESQELTLLVPDLMTVGIVSIAVQRQPDTRIHFVLADGTVAICTFEAQEQVLCWSKWSTDGTVERAMVLPGSTEDAVYYHINRTIGGVTKRYLERWAKESESEGDTGLSWIADCAASYTDTGRATALTGFSHLNGEQVVVWASDTGATNIDIPSAGMDLSPDVAGVQTLYTVSGGTVTVTRPVHHAVAGLPFTADYGSTKLAFAAQAGTALTQMKNTDKIGFVLHNTHNNGLFFGNDTGVLDALPRTDEGAAVDPDKIFVSFDQAAMPFPGLWNADSRIHLRAKAPRPATVMAAVPTVNTSEKV